MINDNALPIQEQHRCLSAVELPGVVEPQRGQTQSVASSDAWFLIVILARTSVGDALAYAHRPPSTVHDQRRRYPSARTLVRRENVRRFHR